MIPDARRANMTAMIASGLAARLCVAVMAGFVPLAAAHAQTPDQFDKPSSVQIIRPKPEESTEIRCTYFTDLMIRETQDGPDSENAVLVRNAKAPCTAKPGSGETILDTSGMTLDGRRGAFLLFSDLNPHGATGFVVIDARTGKILLRDSALSNPVLQSLALENGNLRLRYRRGVNAPCSLRDDVRSCWAQLVRERLVPADMTVPAAQICNETYARDNAPRDNPSIVVYATEVVIDTGGKANVVSRGAAQCEPLP